MHALLGRVQRLVCFTWMCEDQQGYSDDIPAYVGLDSVPCVLDVEHEIHGLPRPAAGLGA